MPTSIELTDRLSSELANAGLAIDGTSGVVTPYNPATVVVYPANLQASAQSIINAFDGSQAAQDNWTQTVSRSQKDAVLFITLTDANARAYRAVAAIMVDEINSLRQWIVGLKAQMALASTLADLKTRVATLPNMPDRTLTQAKSAFVAKVNSGT